MVQTMEPMLERRRVVTHKMFVLSKADIDQLGMQRMQFVLHSADTGLSDMPNMALLEIWRIDTRNLGFRLLHTRLAWRTPKFYKYKMHYYFRRSCKLHHPNIRQHLELLMYMIMTLEYHFLT